MTDATSPNGAGAGPITAFRGLGRQGAWTLLQLAGGALASVGVAAVAVRRMGADEFGQAAVVLAVAGVVSVLDVGLAASVVRTIAGNRRDGASSRAMIESEVRTAAGVYAAVAVLVSCVTVCASIWAAVSEAPFTGPATIATVGAGVAVFAGGAPVVAVAVGRRDFRGVAVTSSVGAAVNLGMVLVLAANLGAASVGLAYFSGTLTQRVLLAIRVRRAVPWLRLRPVRPRWNAVRPLLAFSAPLVLTALMTQVVSASDLVTLSVLSSATAVGLYRLGSALPTWSVGAVYRVYDVAFPALVEAGEGPDQLRVVRILSRLASLAAGAGFGMLVLERAAIMRIAAGDVAPLAGNVLAVFALTWACNVPTHGFILLLTARAQHHFLPWVVAGEALTNVALTIVLVLHWGPIGAAYATLATLVLSNLVVLPAVSRSRVPESWSLVYRDGALPVVVGGTIAAAVATITRVVADGTMQSVAAATITIVLVAPVGWLLTRPPDRALVRSAFQRDGAA